MRYCSCLDLYIHKKRYSQRIKLTLFFCMKGVNLNWILWISMLSHFITDHRFVCILCMEETVFLLMFQSKLTIGTLRSNDPDGNENIEKTIGLISKTTTLHVHHACLYISFLFFHDYDVNMPNFAFYGGRKQATTKLCLSFWAWLWTLEIQLQKGSPTFHKVSGLE